MSEAISRLEGAGYGADFRAEGGRLHCPACGASLDPSDATVDEIVRFEGTTDPDDEAALFALRCDECGTKGTYAVAFGPAIEPDDAEVVRHLSRR